RGPGGNLRGGHLGRMTEGDYNLSFVVLPEPFAVGYSDKLTLLSPVNGAQDTQDLPLQPAANRSGFKSLMSFPGLPQTWAGRPTSLLFFAHTAPMRDFLWPTPCLGLTRR